MLILFLKACCFAMAGLLVHPAKHSHLFSASMFPGKAFSVLSLFASKSSAYQPRQTSGFHRKYESVTTPPRGGTSKRKYRNVAKEVEDNNAALKIKREAIQFGILGMAVKGNTGAKRPIVPVSGVEELRTTVLDDKYPFSRVELSNQLDAALQEQIDETFLQNHEVLRLIKQRFESGSKPGHRQDNATLALSIEGGGMRGCVSAGMAAALASLGLTDAIDKIYGSSAGSVVGSYMVSRQMCVDVYVDILPAAKEKFFCKRRLVSSLAKSLVEVVKNSLSLKTSSEETFTQSPGMNISFVLDSIMGQDHGVRPLDLEAFKQNNAHQELRIVASCVDEHGHLITKCFGDNEFFGDNIMRRVDGQREGLFACLEASMTVPAATGPPVELTCSTGSGNSSESPSLHCFDAFCFEPIPYRSAVEEGATHVLALSSRPLGFQPKSKPGVYETTAAPLYFYYHGQNTVANFFENGGQQYLYAEDLLTLQDAKRKLSESVPIPPPKILYGLGEEHLYKLESEIRDRDNVWKKAHLLPIQVPPTTPELGTLEQDKDAVLEAVRGGYSAAFNLLAPIVGLQPELVDISGCEVAKLVFPDLDTYQNDTLIQNFYNSLLQTKVHVPGDPLMDDYINADRRRLSTETPNNGIRDISLSHTLLSALPGFQGGRLHHLSRGLRYGSHLYFDLDHSSPDRPKRLGLRDPLA